MGCRVLLALLVLHRAKLLASNQSILLWGEAPVQVVSHLCHRIVQWLCAADCKHPCLVWGGSPTLSPGMDAGRVCPRALQGCKANQAYTAFHRGEGVWGFGKDAEIERPKALQDAKPTKRSYRDREFALSYKKQTFSTN